MQEQAPRLTTPIYLKTTRNMTRPKDNVSYILSRNGLFVARNQSLLGSSCVPARGYPCELERQEPYFLPSFPPIPQRVFERIVGFFDIIAMRWAGEAIAHLAWDRNRSRYRVLVPAQVATLGLTRSNHPYPIGVEYQTPANLAPGCVVLGDVHSHVDGPAYASRTDQDDEAYAPGLHIIVGRLDQEPPEIKVAVVIDGYRFELPWRQAIAGYEKRRWRVPRSWLELARARVISPAWPPACATRITVPDAKNQEGAQATNGQDTATGSTREEANHDDPAAGDNPEAR